MPHSGQVEQRRVAMGAAWPALVMLTLGALTAQTPSLAMAPERRGAEASVRLGRAEGLNGEEEEEVAAAAEEKAADCSGMVRRALAMATSEVER